MWLFLLIIGHFVTQDCLICSELVVFNLLVFIVLPSYNAIFLELSVALNAWNGTVVAMW